MSLRPPYPLVSPHETPEKPPANLKQSLTALRSREANFYSTNCHLDRVEMEKWNAQLRGKAFLRGLQNA